MKLLTPADYQTAISSGDAFVVNVHIPYDGEIEGTDAFLPYDKIAEHAAELSTPTTSIRTTTLTVSRMCRTTGSARTSSRSSTTTS